MPPMTLRNRRFSGYDQIPRKVVRQEIGLLIAAPRLPLYAQRNDRAADNLARRLRRVSYAAGIYPSPTKTLQAAQIMERLSMRLLRRRNHLSIDQKRRVADLLKEVAVHFGPAAQRAECSGTIDTLYTVRSFFDGRR